MDWDSRAICLPRVSLEWTLGRIDVADFRRDEKGEAVR